ncbi:glutamine amidotransferase [Corynebacterium kutscheri]|nr:glutamine amidotransferase [Corynebacterium kutscheri]
MVSLLLVSPRSGLDVAHAEYNDVLRATRLQPEQLDQKIIDDTTKTIGCLADYDGVIVGGSPLNVTEPDYCAWQKHVHEQLHSLVNADLPVFFICFGSSLLTYLTGGEVGRTHPEESGATTVTLTQAALTDRITYDLPESFTSLTGHTENTIAVGTGTVVLATGSSCPIQMIRANDTTWACQFHAEMDAAAMKTRMDFYYDYGYFSPERYDAIVATLPDVNTTYSNQVLRNFVEVCEGKR